MLRPKLDLAQQLEEKAKALEQYYDLLPPDPKGREYPAVWMDALTKTHLEEIKGILKSLKKFDKPLEEMLDTGIHDLTSAGMKTNRQTGEVENVFAEHETPKLKGKKGLDGSEFQASENFGQVIKDAFGLDFKKADSKNSENVPGRERAGGARNQAALEKVQAYETALKAQPQSGAQPPQYVRDLIGIRSAHSVISTSAVSTSEFLDGIIKTIEDPNASAVEKGLAAGQLHGLVKILRLEAEQVRKINSYSNLMTAEEFSKIMPIHISQSTLDKIRVIKEELTHLQPDTSSVFGFVKKGTYTHEERFQHLADLQKLVIEVNNKLSSNPEFTPEKKAELNKLLNQIDYAMIRETSLMKPIMAKKRDVAAAPAVDISDIEGRPRR